MANVKKAPAETTPAAGTAPVTVGTVPAALVGTPAGEKKVSVGTAERKKPGRKPAATKAASAKPASSDKKTPGRKPAETKAAAAKTTAPAEAKKPGRKPAAAKAAVPATAEAKKSGRKPAASKADSVKFKDVVAKAKALAKAKKGSISKISGKIAATFEVLSGDSQKDFYIVIENGKAAVEPYRYDEADIWLKGSPESIAAVMDNKIKFIDAVSSGTIQIFGKDAESAQAVVLFVAAIF